MTREELRERIAGAAPDFSAFAEELREAVWSDGEPLHHLAKAVLSDCHRRGVVPVLGEVPVGEE